jgi:F0F1-type ATP synthase membrane subunit b/b'
MMGSYGVIFWAVYGFLMLLILAVALVWTYFSIKFFKKAAEYYQNELDNKEKKDAQTLDLLAKFDQLVDVLKVK